jgi:transposase
VVACRRWAGQARGSTVAGRGVVRGGGQAAGGGAAAAGSRRIRRMWRRRWRASGVVALASKGPGAAVCRLSGAQLARLRAALEGGAAARGSGGNQRWTLARVTALIGRMFHVRCTLRGTSYLLHRIEFTPQVPVHRAAGRNEKTIMAWRTGTWAKVRG